MKNYFAFIDESGNLKSEDFFGLGMLLVEDVGSLYNATKPYYNKARDIAKLQKEKTISGYLSNKQYQDLAKIAVSSKSFELKFKYVNFTNNNVYRGLIEEYFRHRTCRFAAVVVDRKDPKFEPEEIYTNPWEMYMSYASLLVSGTLNNLKACNICILADDLTKPKSITGTFESSLTEKIEQRIRKDGVDRKIFSVARLESHSSLMLQLVDVLLGAILYDFKKSKGLISSKLQQRQESVVGKVRETLGKSTLADHFTVNHPSYFNVWKIKWK